MLNKTVNFGRINRLQPITPLPVAVKITNKSSLQRRFYLFLGILALIGVVLSTAALLYDTDEDSTDFAFCLLLIVHASFLLFFLVSTVIHRSIGDSLTTVIALLLLAIYTTTDYVIRYRHCSIHHHANFVMTTVRLILVLAFVVAYSLWTYLLVRNHYYHQETIPNKEKFYNDQRKLFFSLLCLSLMLIISSLILNIRTRHNFDLYHTLLLSIGIPLAFLWCIAGILMSIFKNCLCTTFFYLLSIGQPLHLINLVMNAVDELSSANEKNNLFPLLIVLFVCACASILVHLFTASIGCWMLSKKQQKFQQLSWMIFSIMSISENNDDDEMDLAELNGIDSDEKSSTPPTLAPENRTISSLSTTRTALSQHQQSNNLQIQNVSLCQDKSQSRVNENSDHNKTDVNPPTTVLSTKLSIVPGPVGLLPLLKSNDELRRLKEDKSAHETVPTNDTGVDTTKPKKTSDLFSMNIVNYPSYIIALTQLQETFGCKPISIGAALVKARLGIKKRIPLMCAAVTNYDRQENTILLDKSAHIRATFIGDDELLDSFNIRVGHTLVLRNVSVFTSTRHRHHYVNIHLHNIVAIQDPLSDGFSLPAASQQQRPSLHAIENELSAYEDASKTNNETFHVFSQPDEDEQQPTKKSKLNAQPTAGVSFANIKPKDKSPPPSAIKFNEPLRPKPNSTFVPVRPRAPDPEPAILNVVTPPSSVAGLDLLQIVEKPIDADLSTDALMSDIEQDEFFATW